MRHLLLVYFIGFLATSDARWLRQGRSSQPRETSFIGEATNQISTAIFQGYLGDEKNIAFSPLGYSAILAILAEGAKGQTKEQLTSALHLPDNQQLTRNTYQLIMERLKNTHEYKYNQPELRNFFYIYKNYTINDDYKKILEEYYLTDVRSVERYTPEHIDHNSGESSDYNTEPPKENEKKDEITIDLVPPKESNEKLISFAVEDTPEKLPQTEYKPAKNIKEQIKLVKTFPKKDEAEDEEETMVAVEARNHARSMKILVDNNDITSSISVNSVGKKTKSSSSNSLMIIFNGMYFRGAWKKPFDKVEQGVFYKSSSEKKQVQMMKSRGVFKSGSLPGLDSEAIEIPYDGGRYALLILVPRARDGLARLIADLPSAPLSEIQDSLTESELDVSIPTFYLETTTKPVAALAKFGVSSIFSPEADLSGISTTEGLFVQELVQHVAVRVDNAGTTASQMSASNAVQDSLMKTLVQDGVPRFSVEQPFLFFILDRLDNLVVVAGKVNDPQQSEFDI